MPRLATARRLTMPEPIPGSIIASMPSFIPPIKPVLGQDVPNGSTWLHELKYDGYRMQAHIENGSVRMLSKSGLDWTARFGPITRTLQHLPVRTAIIDGEVIVQDESGVSSFSGLQSDLKSGRKDRLAYFVFDLMYLDGFDLRPVALGDRRVALEKLTTALPAESRVCYSAHTDDGAALYARACELGLEGIVSKLRDRPYSEAYGYWIKSKCVLRDEFVVLGYLPSTAIKDGIGALVLGSPEHGRYSYAGRAGTGFTDNLAVGLRTLLNSIAGPKPELSRAPSPAMAKGVKWVRPQLLADVHHRGRTADGLLRQVSFKGIRQRPSSLAVKTPSDFD